jgi:hypothetical protein
VTAEAERVLADVGLPAEPDLVARVGGYLRRTRRGRRYGLVAGFAVGAALSLLIPFQPSQLELRIPLLLAGYVLGILVAELGMPVAARRGRRAADLSVRSSAGLVPRWARAGMWASALPVLAAVVLLPAAGAMVRTVRGAGLIQTASYTCFGTPVTWTGTPTLAVAGSLAITGLLIAEYGLAALARRPRPADDATQARLDDALRAMSARAIAGGAAALGLALTAMVCDAVAQLSSANVRVAGAAQPVPQYPWVHAYLDPWAGLAGLGFLIAAVVTVAKCRRRHDPRLVVRHEPMRGTA